MLGIVARPFAVGLRERVTDSIRLLRRASLVALLLHGSLALAPSPALAEDEPADDKIDLRLFFPNEPRLWIRPSIRWDTAWFVGFDAWGGDTTANIGSTTNGWGEIGLVPGLDAQFDLEEHGTLTGRVSGVYSTTQFGLDFAGSNFNNGHTTSPQEFTLEDAWVRWLSGETVPSLGTDAIDLSFGAQQYIVGMGGGPGDGFLFYNGGSDGGNRGGYWLGLRNAYQLTAIARVTSGPWMAEGVYLRVDERQGNHSNAAGGNVQYDFAELIGLKRFVFGLGYWNLFDSDDKRRDDLNVVDIRLNTIPIPGVDGFHVAAEFVKENNASKNDSYGTWGLLGYDFAENDVPLSPYVSFRYAYFSGNDSSSGDDESFDPLFYGFSDWEYWYIGEISGEWVTGNSNFQAAIGHVRVNPTDDVTMHLFYIYQRLNQFQSQVVAPGGRPIDPRTVNITDKDLSHEIDFIVDWSVNQYISTSFVAAVLVPLKGAKQFFGNDLPWTQFMVYTSVKF